LQGDADQIKLINQLRIIQEKQGHYIEALTCRVYCESLSIKQLKAERQNAHAASDDMAVFKSKGSIDSYKTKDVGNTPKGNPIIVLNYPKIVSSIELLTSTKHLTKILAKSIHATFANPKLNNLIERISDYLENNSTYKINEVRDLITIQ